MIRTEQHQHVTRATRNTLLTLLETLPDAFFVVDDVDTILYVNRYAQALTGATPEALHGHSFWRCAPHLVSISLYQAVLKARQTQKQTDVEYLSPLTRTWLHARISPTSAGIAVLFQENTEPTLLQDALRQNEQKYRDLLENISDRVAILTPEGLVLEINQHPLAESSLRREEVIGLPITEMPWWSYALTVQQQLHAAIEQAKQGEIVHFEARIRPQEGKYRDLAVVLAPHLNPEGQVEYLISVGLDITARKQAEAETRALLNALTQLIWTGRPDGYIDSYSQSWCDYTGLTTQKAQGDGWMQCTHPDDQQRVLAVWQHAVQAGRPYETEQRLRQGTSGTYRWFLMQAMPLRDAQGAVLKYVGTCTDIEDRKRAEQKLKESEENWRVLVETVPQLVWTISPDGAATYFNQRYCDYVGASPEHILGFEWRQFVHQDDLERTLAVRRHSLETGSPYEIEYRLKESNTGRYRWFLTRALPVRDETGQIIKWFGTCTDIEDQKRIEEALRLSQQRVRALVDSNIIGIVSSEGEEEVLIEANEPFLQMSGYTQEEIDQRTLTRARIIAPEDEQLCQHKRQDITARGQHTPFEARLVCKDGSCLPILAGEVLFQNHPRQMLAFMLDNTARKELERRKDDFLSMASHELKTPLTSLKLQIQLVKKRLERQNLHDAAEALSRVEKPVGQLDRLIRELLDVSKIQAGRLELLQETINLDALLHEVGETMEQINGTHTIVVHDTPPLSLVGDRDRLEQVFTNLLSNAIKYSPDAPLIEIDVSALAEIVTVNVHDHGIGIPKEQREKIFERFYRAFDPSQRAIPGLGMGLYIVAEIVKQHGGTITVESEVGKGSTFHVRLPLKQHD